MSRIKLDTSNKVDLSHLMQFQSQVGEVLTRDLNRLEDKVYNLMDTSEKRFEKLMDTSEKRVNNMMDTSEKRFNKFMEAMEARIKSDREASEARIAADRKDFLERSAADRKEFASQKRWLIGIFATLVVAIFTGAIAIASFFITNGFQV